MALLSTHLRLKTYLKPCIIGAKCKAKTNCALIAQFRAEVLFS